MEKRKKLCIRKFDSLARIETFYNAFEKEIVSYDVRVVPVAKSKSSFLLLLEYLE